MEFLVERAVIVGVHEQKDQHFEYAMEELKTLLKQSMLKSLEK